MTQEELNELLESHYKWLHDLGDGEQLYLNKKDLRHLDLADRDLESVVFQECNLSNQDFGWSTLRHAVFIDCNLEGVEFSGKPLPYIYKFKRYDTRGTK